MKRNLSLLTLTAVVLAAVPSAVRAQTYTPITQWNFNSTTPDANTVTGSATPSTGSGSLAAVGGTASSFASGSPGDTNGVASGDNSALATTTYPAQGTGTGTAGVQFNASTAGFLGSIQVSLDFRQSGTASRYFQLQLSSDGANFANASGGTGSFGTLGAGNTLTTFDNTGLYTNNSGGGSQTFVQGISYTLPAGSMYSNDANFAFRWVAVYDVSGTAPGMYISSNAGTAAAYTTAGTARFDDVTISAAAVPEPSTYALVGAAGLGLVALARRRSVRA